PVVLRALVRFAQAPFGLEPPALLEPVKRRIQRAGFDPEQVLGLRADRLADAVAVLRPPLEGPQDEHVEGALEELQAPVVGRLVEGVDSLQALDVERLQLVSWGLYSLTVRSALARRHPYMYVCRLLMAGSVRAVNGEPKPTANASR